MNKDLFFFLMRILFIALIFLLSCSGEDDTGSKVDIFSQQGILLLGNGTEPSGIDPHIVTGVPEHKILLALLEGLVVFNPKNNGVLPGVASDWSISKDGLIYTFTFNPDAKWTNGEIVKPEHFVYSWERILSPELGAQYADMLYVIKNAESFHKNQIKMRLLISLNQNQISFFTNYGKVNVDLFAPGDQIWSTIPDKKFDYHNGTSMAAPNASGVAAVVRSFFPRLSAAEVKRVLMNSGMPLFDRIRLPGTVKLSKPEIVSKSGKLINLYNALIYASNKNKNDL